MPSILIVDDLVSVHEMLEAVIEPTGYTTAFATDGEKALARYKTEKFDLVLADVDMKPMDGITLLKELKAYDPSVVVVIQTAYASTDSAIAALKLGALDYLKKPFQIHDLLGTLRRGLEFRAQQVRLSEAPAGAQSADLAARLPGARINQLGSGRSAVFRVALGPFADVPGVDLALERTLASGVSGARIIVE